MAEMNRGSIEVEVVYALPRTQTVMTLTVPAGTSVGQVIARSGIAAKCPDIDWNAVAFGIFGKRVSPAAILEDRDRIEIYRPLVADPKRARRTRARKAGKNTR